MTNNKKYKLLVEHRAKKEWDHLNEARLDVMNDMKAFLKKNPTNILVTKGKAKKLKGTLSGWYQYDISGSERVMYEVDKKANQVKIVYAGNPH